MRKMRSIRMRELNTQPNAQLQSFGSIITQTTFTNTFENFENQDLSYKTFNKQDKDKYKNANFINTAIYNAIFDEVNLDGADFTKTQNTASGRPPYVSFKKSSLINATFKDAYLEDAIFTDAILSGVDFTGANLRGVNFTGANLTNAIFKNVKNLAYAKFTRATIVNVDFTGAINVRLNTDFTDAIFSPPFNTSEWEKCNSYAFQCRNIDTVSDSDLKSKIAENPTRYCNEVMGRSCGDMGNRESTFNRWVNLGGRCPPESEVKGSGYDFGCTTGCHKTDSQCLFCTYVCQ